MDKLTPEARVAALEAELAAERAALTENLATLRDRLRPAALARSAGQALKDRILPSRAPAAPRRAPVSVAPVGAPPRPAPSQGGATAAAPGPVPEHATAPQGGLGATALRVLQDRPLIGMALLAAAGAAVGAALPQRDRETAVLRDAKALATGEARHFLLDEALTLALSLAGSLFDAPPVREAPKAAPAARRAA